MMTVEDVMTRDVISVSPETSIHRAAQMMVKHGVSGLPVIDHGDLVGIISEGDLILRQTRRESRPWWKAFFEDGGRLADEYRKAGGTTVGDVMTRPVVSISPVFGIETAAAILTNRNIRRLPVVRDGRLVGIVSRGDLVRALACGAGSPREAGSPPHAGVRAAPRLQAAAVGGCCAGTQVAKTIEAESVVPDRAQKDGCS